MEKHSGETEAPSTHWSDRAFVTVKHAGEICGISPASIYAAAKAGEISLQKLRGRSVVATSELRRFIEKAATPWTPSPSKAHNTAEARAARTRAAWAGA